MSVEKVLVSVIAALFQGLAATIIISKQTMLKNKNRVLKLFLSLWLYCIFAYLFIPNSLRFISFITIVSLVLYFLLKIQKSEVLIFSFNTELIVCFSEILISLLLVFCRLESKDIVSNPFYNLLANVLISLVSILLIYLKPVNMILKKEINIVTRNRRITKYIYVFTFILYLVLLKNGFEVLMMSNYYINLLFMISIILIIVIILKNESKYEQLKEENRQMLNYVTKYEKIITAQGKTNHEFKNQLMVIRGYAQMHSDKIIEYIDEIVEDSNKAGSSYLISQLNNFPDGGIKGLLYYKLSIMEDENIKYSINVEKGVKTKLKTLSTNNYKNITKILGVLLDNAIDASKKSKHKKINISVIKDNKNIIFKIYNTYKGKIDIEKVGTGYTSKGKGHGYGLRLVKDIINEDKLFNISHNLEDNYFVSSLYIKK
jgi:two-component system sensor histidine kinase AgrC